ncbi:MAG: alpha/beta hydrolase, partial [Gammaproteobacteria bacterium]|nr:alpha/beta hydrolase [Gammaproteobacteria bacterium]
LFTLEHSARVERLQVLDIAPVAYSHSHAPFLEALMEVDLAGLKSRSEADRKLQAVIPDNATRLFLLQNLSGSAGAYTWRINLPVLHKFMPQITGFPEVHNSVANKALFIAGELSDYVLSRHHAGILELFPNSQFISIADAGHWLHVEQPQRVLEVVSEFAVHD